MGRSATAKKKKKKFNWSENPSAGWKSQGHVITLDFSPPLLVYTGDTHITLLSSLNVNGFVLISSGRYLQGELLIRKNLSQFYAQL